MGDCNSKGTEGGVKVTVQFGGFSNLVEFGGQSSVFDLKIEVTNEFDVPSQNLEVLYDGKKLKDDAIIEHVVTDLQLPITILDTRTPEQKAAAPMKVPQLVNANKTPVVVPVVPVVPVQPVVQKPEITNDQPPVPRPMTESLQPRQSPPMVPQSPRPGPMQIPRTGPMQTPRTGPMQAPRQMAPAPRNTDSPLMRPAIKSAPPSNTGQGDLKRPPLKKSAPPSKPINSNDQLNSTDPNNLPPDHQKKIVHKKIVHKNSNEPGNPNEPGSNPTDMAAIAQQIMKKEPVKPINGNANNEEHPGKKKVKVVKKIDSVRPPGENGEARPRVKKIVKKADN